MYQGVVTPTPGPKATVELHQLQALLETAPKCGHKGVSRRTRSAVSPALTRPWNIQFFGNIQNLFFLFVVKSRAVNPQIHFEHTFFFWNSVLILLKGNNVFLIISGSLPWTIKLFLTS